MSRATSLDYGTGPSIWQQKIRLGHTQLYLSLWQFMGKFCVGPTMKGTQYETDSLFLFFIWSDSADLFMQFHTCISRLERRRHSECNL